jgi:hypothetical protein
MGKQYEQLSARYIEFIRQQKMFFVGTAAATGKVNISPKGGDSLRILGPSQLVWLNATGSGNETSAHVQKLPRMTVMFCSFDGAPVILRLYGSAKVLHKTDPLWDSYIDLFPKSVSARQLYLLDIELVLSSCGTVVPLFDYVQDRTEMDAWIEKRGQDGIEDYWAQQNQLSLDGFETNILTLNGLSESK